MDKRIQKECESGCEYILPDYMGDIKKILMSNARVIPAGKFAGGESAEFSGVVEYEILYADSDGKLTAILTTSDYSVSCAVDGEHYLDSREDSRVSSFAIRITGPRKIILKANVESVITLTELQSHEVSGDAFDSSREPEISRGSVIYEQSLYGESGEREYAEEAERIPGVSADEIEIITSNGSVRISEARAVEDGVEVKGEIIMTAIIKTPQQPPFAIKKLIPFSEVISISGASADMLASADGYVSSASCGVNYENEECVIVVNAIAEYNAAVTENKTVSVVADAYLKEADTKNEYSDFEYSTAVESFVRELVVNVKMPRSELGLSDARSIISAIADVRSSDFILNSNGAQFSGEIQVCGVACEINADESIGYIPIKCSALFSSDVNFNCQIPQNAKLSYTLIPIDCEAYLDGEELCARCFLKLKVHLCSQNRKSVLVSSSVVPGSEREGSASLIRVYYPIENETLFEVAKKFHTSVEKLASDNSLSESVMNGVDKMGVGVKKLIIF